MMITLLSGVSARLSRLRCFDSRNDFAGEIAFASPNRIWYRSSLAQSTIQYAPSYCNHSAGSLAMVLDLMQEEELDWRPIAPPPPRLLLTMARTDSNIILNWRCFVPFISVPVCKHSNKLKFDMGKCRREEGTLLFLCHCRTAPRSMAGAFSIRYGSAPKGIFGDSNQFSDS